MLFNSPGYITTDVFQKNLTQNGGKKGGGGGGGVGRAFPMNPPQIYLRDLFLYLNNV